MKPSKKINTIASDEEQIRFSIYTGEIPLGEAGGELIKLALATVHRVDRLTRLTTMALENVHKERDIIIKYICAPWPLRWWWYFRGILK